MPSNEMKNDVVAVLDDNDEGNDDDDNDYDEDDDDDDNCPEQQQKKHERNKSDTQNSTVEYKATNDHQLRQHGSGIHVDYVW